MGIAASDYRTTVLISLFKCMLSRKWVSLQSHSIINLYLQSMDQFQQSLLTLPSYWCFLFHSTHGADFLARTKPQRMKAQRVLSGLAADASYAPSCLDANPLQPRNTHPWLSARANGPNFIRSTSVSSGLRRSTQQHCVPGSKLSAQHGNDPVHLLSAIFVRVQAIQQHCILWEKVELGNLRVESLLLSFWELLLVS